MRRHVPAVPEVEMTHQQQKVEEENMLPSDNLGPILNTLHFHDVCHLPLYLETIPKRHLVRLEANSFLLGPRHNEN
jgi:hypothetical protein